MISKDAFIAANRFGLGPRPRELETINKNPREWLRNQISKTPTLPTELRNITPAIDVFKKYIAARKLKGKDAKKMSRKSMRQGYVNDVYSRSLVMIRSDQPFAERMVRFWSNHFTVSGSGRKVVGPMSVSYETDVIRPHIFSNFEDMLLDVVQHPAMLMYLDNHISAGPNSHLGQKRKRGLNENLAREIMELHTLGVNGGYTQKDVTEFAKILTGWSIDGMYRKAPPSNYKSGFQFKPWLHEPGPKTILNRPYQDMGQAEGMDALRFLAHHPSTAKFIATKLVRHFVSDIPPASAIAKIEKVFIASKGNLAKVSHALIDLQDIWQSPISKIKQPYELMISAFRALGIDQPKRGQVLKSFRDLQQMPFQAGSPAGWSDLAEDWLTPEALMHRIEWTRALAAQVPRSLNPQKLFAATIAAAASPETKLWIDRAPSGEEAIALILASPEFQRR